MLHCPNCNAYWLEEIGINHLYCIVCGYEFMQCESCEGKGYFKLDSFNEDNEEFDQIDCDKCNGEGITKYVSTLSSS